MSRLSTVAHTVEALANESSIPEHIARSIIAGTLHSMHWDSERCLIPSIDRLYVDVAKAEALYARKRDAAIGNYGTLAHWADAKTVSELRRGASIAQRLRDTL